MEPLSDTELLEKIKQALGITGEYQNETLMQYITEVKEFMQDAGVKTDVVNASCSAGCISRGVADLWSYGDATAQFSPYFIQRVTQLSYKKIDGGDQNGIV